MREIKGDGKLNSPMLLLGEAPGHWEHKSGLPFVGKTGQIQMGWWRGVNLARADFRIDNVYRFQPPKNKLGLADRDAVNESAVELHDRIARMTGLKIIVPTGNFALRAVLRKPLWDNKSPKVKDWRGSILRYQHPTLGEVLVIPTYHPAATFRKPTLEPLCVFDWRKIASVLRDGPPKLPAEDNNIAPTRADVRAFKQAVDAVYEADPKWACMSIDIETNPKEREIICMGFALNAWSSITFLWHKWQKTIRWLCEHPIAKVGQFAYSYDRYWLWMKAKIWVNNYRWDDGAMHHCYRPYLPHDLGTQTSLYTPHPFHKHSAKDEESIKVEKTPIRALMRYCGKDNMRQRELRDAHLEGLRRS